MRGAATAVHPTPLLADAGRWQALDAQGYVVVPLLDGSAVRRLQQLYRDCAPPGGATDLWESSRHHPYALNRRINTALRAEVAAAGTELFARGTTVYGGSFMVKGRRDSTMLALHQDWSVVDERAHTSLFVWCALDSIDARNGGLFVLPGSHRFFEGLRSGTYPSDRFHLTVAEHRYVVDLALAPGQAVLYFDRLFHGSYANQGAADRVVATARLTGPHAPLRYYQRVNAREVDVYDVDERFYLTHIDALARGALPARMPGRPRRHAYRHEPVTEARLRERLRGGEAAVQAAPATPTAADSLFRDPEQARSFARDGFVVVDLLAAREVAALQRFHATLAHGPPPPGGFQVTLDHGDPAFVRHVGEGLLAAVRGRLGELFQHHRTFTASFVTKVPDAVGIVPPHQDWTFVDETRYWSATVWCPLLETAAENGALGLIRGSHGLYDHVRPSPSPQYRPPFADQLASLFPYLQLQLLRPGQAVVFDNRTLHGSPPNTTGESRLAFGIGITHRDAQLRHYHLMPGRGGSRIEGFAIEPAFFHRYNNARLTAMHERGERIVGAYSLGVFALEHRSPATSALVRRLEQLGNVFDAELAERVAPALAALHAPTGTAGGASSGRADVPARPFWQVYTPLNIYREIRHRLAGGDRGA